MRHSRVCHSVTGLCAALLLLAFGAVTAAAGEAPTVGVQPNSPGWITVTWQAAELGSEAEIEFRAGPRERPTLKNVWRAPMARLVQGAYVPLAVTGAPADGLQMRIRVVSPTEGPWSTPVVFDLVPGSPQKVQPIQGQAPRAIQAAPKAIQPAPQSGGSAGAGGLRQPLQQGVGR